MTRDDITRMAREAGFVGFDGENKCLCEFAALVAAAEREACAQICDAKAKRNFPWGSENADKYHAQADWAEHIAVAIRARGEK